MIAVDWNTCEHTSVSRVEVQLWDVDKNLVLKRLQNPDAYKEHVGLSSFQGMRLNGSLAAFSSDLEVRFAEPLKGEHSSALRANQLLAQQILPAHVGCATSPSFITVENLPMLTPVIFRLRLHSSNASVNQNFGPWGPPLLIIMLPDGNATNSSVRSDTLKAALVLGLSSPVPAASQALGPVRVKAREGVS